MITSATNGTRFTEGERFEFWLLNDPKGQDLSTTRQIVNEIKEKVDKLSFITLNK